MYNFPPYLGGKSCNKHTITNISEIRFSSKDSRIMFAYKYVKTFQSLSAIILYSVKDSMQKSNCCLERIFFYR